MNTTHQFYQNLVNANPTLLSQLEQLAKASTSEEIQERLQPHVPVEVREELDYTRLHALLRKDLSGEDLTGEDFTGMSLRGFNFAHARLREARLAGADLREANFADASLAHADMSDCDLTSASFIQANCVRVLAKHATLESATLELANWNDADVTGANLTDVCARSASFASALLDHADFRYANLCEANCSGAGARWSRWGGADLRGTNLAGADLCWSDLSRTRLEGANLLGCIVSKESFGETWQIDQHTQIDTNNRVLIGQALLSQARTAAQTQFALYVQFQTNQCWQGFVEQLLREHNHNLITWAKDILSAIDTLRGKAEEWAVVLEGLRRKRQSRLEYRFTDLLGQSNPQVAELLRTEAELHAQLSTRALSCYLRGVLAGARDRTDLHLNDEQYQKFDQQLQQIIGDDEDK